MYRALAIFSLLATVAAAQVQSGSSQTGGSEAPVPQTSDSQTTAPSQAAPIVRTYQRDGFARYRPAVQPERVVDSQPIAGVWLRSLSSSAVKTVSSTQQHLEVRLEHGRLNVDVHHPADHAEILIDLPGGQTSLLKDGLYTFNAETNTVRVLHGEAAFVGAAGANAKAKPIKVKEDHQLSLVAENVKPSEAYPYELSADLLPRGDRGEQGYSGYGEYAPYPYGYPYYAGVWGYPYPYFYPGYYGYPFAYGIGFGYYGGFGGYRGGFRR